MLHYNPQPPTTTALLLELAAPCAALGLDPRRISQERASLVLAHSEYSRESEQLSDALQGVLSNRPPKPGPDDRDGKAEQAEYDWSEEVLLAQCRLIEADCCFHLPLDHEFGERLTLDKEGRPFEAREIEHWLDFEEEDGDRNVAATEKRGGGLNG